MTVRTIRPAWRSYWKLWLLSWLVIPLFWHDTLLGVMVLADSLGKVAFNWEVSDLLKTAAGQASSHLEIGRAHV